jgi:type VI secretion system secreted protein Hcp
VLGIPAVLLLLFPASPAAAQDGDPDQPMIVGMVPGPVAAVDMFLKIDGIDGESVDEAHSDWIEVSSLTWGSTGTPVRATTTVRQGGAQRKRPGRVKYGDITLKKGYDASSPKLAEACANGKHIPALILELTTSTDDGSRYMRVELQDVVISSYGIDATGDRPTESISLNYAKIKTTYIPQEERGKVETTWKVEKGER